MPGDEKDGLLPSYEDSVTSNPSPASQPQLFRSQITRTQSPHRGQQLLDQLTLSRAQNIRSVTNDQILPLIERQALYGIAKTTIALIPSDVPLPSMETEKSEFSFDTGEEKRVEVIGFSSDGEPQIVRLEGQINRTEFWRPQSTIMDLEEVLRDTMNASSSLRTHVPREPVVEAMPAQSRRNFFGRVVSAMSQEQKGPNGNPEVGTRQLDTGEQVLVKVRLEEICLRTMNDFGLYDTMARQCVIVMVDARC